ncbi:hypothetical protein COLO4_04319 [Corchorus olitorius]|uniref:Uncharacterized protein n=1 Tax=Corchorus olitorius TaxID=93759 RepID=A0A1R3KUK7_9ROSI|nr:hypothetical protein COLO4_04319 [Corchorus olitorius]
MGGPALERVADAQLRHVHHIYELFVTDFFESQLTFMAS